MNTYEINARNEVIPYTSGRKCTDTRAWRDATELELQQQDQIQNLERELTAVTEQRDRLAEALRKIKPNCAIRGSVGDYRQGQLDIMDIMAEIAQEALQSLTTNAKSAATGSERNENE
jgi:hypothetical protein